jgi:hypothetical protein
MKVWTLHSAFCYTLGTPGQTFLIIKAIKENYLKIGQDETNTLNEKLKLQAAPCVRTYRCNLNIAIDISLQDSLQRNQSTTSALPASLGPA